MEINPGKSGIGAGKLGINPGKSGLEAPVPAVFPEFPAGFPLFPGAGGGRIPRADPGAAPGLCLGFPRNSSGWKSGAKVAAGEGRERRCPQSATRELSPSPGRERREEFGAGTNPKCPQMSPAGLGDTPGLGASAGMSPMSPRDIPGFGDTAQGCSQCPQGEQEQPQGQPWGHWGHPGTWGHPMDSSGVSPISPEL